ncbi:hypothetical protein SAMN04489806_1475 [Paramicrobacterium humi]|uniref:Uncharacterized protein n=2 Tax=Paramicrobacterium humi TaxID=640635 RepID=A0A1H4LB98_9MICO|nr:hypothetical protein SAMN04489806_1475 [Microbacterium humi]
MPGTGDPASEAPGAIGSDNETSGLGESGIGDSVTDAATPDSVVGDSGVAAAASTRSAAPIAATVTGELAETGADGGAAILGLASLLLLIGAAVKVVSRKSAARRR